MKGSTHPCLHIHRSLSHPFLPGDRVQGGSSRRVLACGRVGGVSVRERKDQGKLKGRFLLLGSLAPTL